MKVKIGPYLNWYGPYQITDYIFFWTKRHHHDEIDRWDYHLKEKFGDWLADTWFSTACNWIDGKRKRTVTVKIDPYDTWSMDHTLSIIIHPMLVQLKATKHSSNWVNDDDVPERLRSTSALPLTDEDKQYGRSDSLMHDRWDWVLDELIWTFANIMDDDGLDFFKEGNFDEISYKEHHDRIANGLLLFGKYYQGLWD